MKILATYIEFLDQYQIMNIAYETAPGEFHAKYRRIAGISSYDLTLTLTDGKHHAPEVALAMFPALADSMQYTVAVVDTKPIIKPLQSLSTLYEECKDLIYSTSENPGGLKTSELLNKLKEIRDLSAPAIVKCYPVEPGA